MCSSRFTLTEVKELVYWGFAAVTPARWQSLLKYVQEKVEDHYWEADGFNEELLEQSSTTVSDSDSDSDDSVSADSDGSDSISYGSMSSSLPTSSDEVWSLDIDSLMCIINATQK